MATKITPVKNLDFAGTKEELKTFLKSQNRFKDFDFEGSNMNVLLDVLAYNSFYSNFYYNMAISEMFLDSASQRNSVLSHAKELNYLPMSRRSSTVKISLAITASTLTGGSSNFFTIPKNTAFIGRCGNKTYNFLTEKAHVASRSVTDSSLYTVSEVDVFEGRLITEVISSENTTLSNPNIDTRSIELVVNGDSYIYKTDIFGVGATDKVFYLQPENDGNYSIQFGQNKFGIQPTITDAITATYRITVGPDANGVTSLTTAPFGGASSIAVTLANVTSGGSLAEDIESIRTFAPKALQVQDRAVTKKDYETLLRARFSNIEAISVYGGDEVDPPQFGKVIISVDVTGTEGASDLEIATFKDYLSDKTPLTIEPVFLSAQFMHVQMSVGVSYDSNTTVKQPADIQAEVLAMILTYQNVNLNDFNKTLLQSNLASVIDSLDVSIRSTDIVSKPLVEYVPPLDIASSPSFDFGTALNKPYAFDTTSGFSSFVSAVESTQFVVDNTTVSIRDDGIGNLMLVTGQGNVPVVFNPTVGTVDYTTGIIKITNLKITSFSGNAIKITVTSLSKDITPPKDRIITIRPEDVTITATPLAV